MAPPFRHALLVALLLGGPVAAGDGLPVFDGTEGYRLLGPYEGGLLVQDRQGLGFLCQSKIANVVLLTDCKPVLTPAQMEAIAAAQAEAAAQAALLAERNRLLALPEADFEEAARVTLSAQGCQADLDNRRQLAGAVLPAFATALAVPEPLQPGLLQLVNDLFTQTLERLLRQRRIEFDRATRVARLVECLQ